MECEKVRDQFSSLWEKELSPSEERVVREHLASCPECQKEFKQFEKTMGWLLLTEEVEVPEGFLSGIRRKMEEPKRSPFNEKTGGRWFTFPSSWKLPVQAVAMVAIVFLALYLTKMTPQEIEHQKDFKPPSATISEDKNIEKALPPKERKSEQKRTDIPLPKPEIKAGHPMESKEGVKDIVPDLERVEKGLPEKGKSAFASRPAKEMVLRVSDREAAIDRLKELIKRYGGEIVSREEDIFLVSMPITLLPDFEQEWVEQKGSSQSDQMISPQRPGPLMAQRKGPARLESGQESRTLVRIHLIQE